MESVIKYISLLVPSAVVCHYMLLEMVAIVSDHNLHIIELVFHDTHYQLLGHIGIECPNTTNTMYTR